MKSSYLSILIISLTVTLTSCNKQENTEKFSGFTPVGMNKETTKFYVDTNSAKYDHDSLTIFNMVMVLPDGYVIQNAETNCSNSLVSLDGVKFHNDGIISDEKFSGEKIPLPSKDNLEINMLVTIACEKAEQAEATKLEIVNPSDLRNTSHLQEETSIGLVKITAHNFCQPEPNLGRCETWITLRYKNMVIKKETLSNSVSIKDVSKNGKFITVESNTGGNCINCSGVHAFKLENEKLMSLGYFNKIENDFLISSYANLEFNGLTAHVNSPSWDLYYKDFGDKIILDLEKTCNEDKFAYDKEKTAILREINNLKIAPSNKKNKDIYGSLLSVLSFSKWCGFENDFSNILSSVNKNPDIFSNEKITILMDNLAAVIKGDDTETLSDIY